MPDKTLPLIAATYESQLVPRGIAMAHHLINLRLLTREEARIDNISVDSLRTLQHRWSHNCQTPDKTTLYPQMGKISTCNITVRLKPFSQRLRRSASHESILSIAPPDVHFLQING